ncbi:MAG: hypothetical protein KatS3mg050_4997 [Litorilinea sp.]|nr:MAG: hypothetical protein KatS3mg050_4997 [Litorilinea sp.]
MAHLLLIEDDQIFAHLLAERLGREGHRVATAPSAEAALEVMANARPPFEMLLVDNRLGPGMSGIELLRQVKQEHPDLDAILFTGLDEPEVGLEAYRAGAYRYLTKPFQPQELLLIIQSLLDWRTARRERDWLYILNEIVARLQGVETVAEVGRVLVEGGLRLGFDRARFYTTQERDGQLFLQGVCQDGAAQVLGFEQILIPLAETTYSARAVERREPTFFTDYEHGPGFLVNYPTTEGDPPQVYGDWVSVPLFSGERCIGVLNLDNCRRPRPVPEEQRKLVRLFAGQACPRPGAGPQAGGRAPRPSAGRDGPEHLE